MIFPLKPITRAQDLFSSLRPEDDPPEDKNFDLKTDASLEYLINGVDKVALADFYEPTEGYNAAVKYISKINPRARDFQSLLINMASRKDLGIINARLGIYISAGLSLCYDDRIRLQIPHELRSIASLGMCNTKDLLEFTGDIGDILGAHMSKGKIIVNGNVGTGVGVFMSGGEIHINGSYDYIFSDKGKIYCNNKLIRLNGREGIWKYLPF